MLPNASIRDVSGENSAFSISWAVLHVLSFVVILRGKWRVSDFFSPPILLGVVAMASSLWSSNPQASLLYGGMLLGNILVARQMVQDLSVKKIIRITTKVILLLCVLGIALYYLGFEQVIWFDTRGRTNFFGGEMLRGLFPHRIAGAAYATIGAVGAIVAFRGAWRVVAIGLSAWFVLLTASATGYVLAIAAIGAYVILRGGVKKNLSTSTFFVTRLIGASILLAAIALFWNSILEALGRDGTLTARTFLWDWGLQAWQVRPFGGWGYSAYFDSDHAIQTHASIAEIRYYDVPHFHQSFIQVGVDLGIVGLLLVILILAKSILGSYRLGMSQDMATGGAFFAYTAVLAVWAFVGYVFPEYNHFGTFLLIVAYFVVQKTNTLGNAQRTGRVITN